MRNTGEYAFGGYGFALLVSIVERIVTSLSIEFNGEQQSSYDRVNEHDFECTSVQL